VLDTRPLRDVPLELGDLRSQNPLATFHRLLNGGLQRRAQPAALGLQVDKGNGLAHASPDANFTQLLCGMALRTDKRNIAK